MPDIFSPAVLDRVVQDLKAVAPSMFLLDTFFPETNVSTAEEIAFDVLTGKPRLAPFVSPFVEGHIVERLGYETKSFKPAYIKDKRIFEAARVARRAPGEPLYAAVDPAANMRRLVAQDSLDQLGMLNRRLEWMAAQVMRTGSVTISGEKYPTTVVNFGRDASLTVTLSGTDLWSDPSAASDPLGDLEDFSGLIRTASGANAVDVVMAEDVWRALRSKPSLSALIEKGTDRRTDLQLGPNVSRGGATFKGTLGDFRLWVYTETYVNEAGSTAKYLPDNYLLLASAGQVEGVRQFGGIKDHDAGLQARDYFPKSWTIPDPSVRYLLLQSAPLVVPYRINATLSAKVL